MGKEDKNDSKSTEMKKGTTETDSTKEMNLEVVWKVERKPGKAVKLYLKHKQQEFSYKIEKEGRYSLALHTPDSLPGGAAGRKVETLVTVYKNLAEPPLLEPAEDLANYVVNEASKEHVILRDVYEVHSKQKTTVVEFELTEKDIPASIHLVAKTHTPLIGMRFAGKLYRNADLASIGEDGGMKFTSDDDWLYETLSIDAIKHEMTRESEYKTKAFEAGLIRPFLMLVSMHPIMRVQIGDLMGIKLIDLSGDEKYSHDPHAQADRILLKHLKGLGSIADHMYETANPLSSKSNWYDCVYRGATEVVPEDHAKLETKAVSSTDKPSKEAFNDDMNKLEMGFITSARGMHQKEIKKLEKDSSALTDQVERYLKDSAVVEMLKTMEENGISEEEARRFVVEVCVANEFKLWRHYYEMENDVKDKDKDEDAEDMARKWGKEKENEKPANTDESYDNEHAVLGGIRAQLMRGNYDPRGLSETGKAVAKKAGQMVAKKAFKHFVLTPMFPFLILPMDIAGLADKVLGSDHQTVWLVSLQLLLQRLLLASHSIQVDDYYKDMKVD